MTHQPGSATGSTKRARRRRLLAIGAVTAATALTLGGLPAAAVDPADLEDRVTVEGVRVHLQAFQDIADANGGNRAAETSGYEASAAYVESVLEEAGYATWRQPFAVDIPQVDEFELTIDGFDFEQEEADAGLPYPLGYPMEGAPSTDESGLADLPLIAPVDPLGCTVDAWEGIDAVGSIALVSRGACTFGEKSLAAGAAGASALLVYNNEPGTTLGLMDPVEGQIPSVGISQVQGEAVLERMATETVTADLLVLQSVRTLESFNVLAETPTGRDDNTVMVGAHLDSVEDGPGINDNGSGSAAILEVAVQLAASGDLENQVRFAWWGAEELGLLGSYAYVEDLAENDPVELDQIATYLNFDMVASPNYVISTYDADQSTYEAPVEVPAGSIETEDAFTSYFDEIGQPYIDTAFDGRSDYDAFILYGIPAGGVFTGADDVKTEEQAELFGGTVGVIHDPNYHTPADDITNVNEEALAISIGAIAHVVAELANDTSAINGVVPVPTPTPTPTPTSAPTPSAPPEEPAPTPTPSASPSVTPPPSTTAPPSAGDPDLAATGGDLPLAGIALGAGFLLLGGAALVAMRRRARA